jgi:hypothetical protein
MQCTVLSYRINECFGIFGFLDWLHGTDKLFRESINGKRHIILSTLTPARDLIPDDVKKDE